MALPDSPELRYVMEEAAELSIDQDQPTTSFHLVLALFMVPNSALLLMQDIGVQEAKVIAVARHAEKSGQAQEDENIAELILEEAGNMASRHGNREVTCIHMLLAMMRVTESLGCRLLRTAEVPLPRLRQKAFGLLNAPVLPKRYRDCFAQSEEGMRRRLGLMHNQAAQRFAPQTQPQATLKAPQAAVVTEDEIPKPKPSRSGKAYEVQPVQPQARQTNPAQEPATPKQAMTPGHAQSGPTSLRSPVANALDAPFLDSTFPLLSAVGRDMVSLAREGRVEPIVGREREILDIVDILNKRRSNNPIIVGPSGCGKTVLIWGLAWTMAQKPHRVPGMEGRTIVVLEPSKLLQGTHLRGTFAERMEQLKAEVRQSEGRIILFIDEIHNIIEGSVDGSQEISRELKNVLGQGDFPCIGTTTPEYYKETFLRDHALARRFQPVELAPPSFEETLEILQGIAPAYESHHKVGFLPEALVRSIRLSDRFLSDRSQPDKAIGLLDLAGSLARREAMDQVTSEIVSRVVSKVAHVPLDQIVSHDNDRYLQLASRMQERVVGHEDALRRVEQVLLRNVAGFRGGGPIGSFLFVGPTGVGKTEVARALAIELFGDVNSMIRFDMSEFSEAHSVSKLIGSPPGYIGFNEGGALTDSVRRKPFQLILFDEIEKAHADVHQLMLQLLDEGRLTDSRGQRADFTNTVIIMTSNMGSEVFEQKQSRGIGFGQAQPAQTKDTQQGVLDAVRRTFSPELFGRIDEKVVFGRLTTDEIVKIAKLLVEKSAKSLLREKGIRLHVSEQACRHLMTLGGYDIQYGARPMRHMVRAQVEAPLAELIVKGIFLEGDSLEAIPVEGGFRFQPLEQD